jgi:hypothetical protein
VPSRVSLWTRTAPPEGFPTPEAARLLPQVREYPSWIQRLKKHGARAAAQAAVDAAKSQHTICPRRYHRRLLRVFYLLSLSSPKSCPAGNVFAITFDGRIN